MKKFFIWTLTVLMLLSMVACNQPADPQEQPTEAPTTAPAEGGTETPTTNGDDKPSEPDDSPLAGAPTYDNSEFTVMFRPDNRFINPVLVESIEANATSMDRVVYERMILIEEALQIKFDIVRAEDYNKEMISSFSNYAKTGVDALDLANVHGRNVPWNLAISKSLYDWNDLSVDLDATYWSQNAKEEFSTAGGKLYFLTGDANYLTVGTAFSMFFNKAMVNNVNGLEMPYQLVRDGEWTFEVFENYVTTIYSNLDGTGTGVLGEDSFGYVTPHTRGPVSILYSTGNSLLTKNQNEPNGYKYTVYKEVITKAMNDYVGLVLKSGSSLYFRASNADVKAQMHTAFIGETVAFIDDEVDFAGTFAKSGMEFGILPWPMYEDAEGYTSLVDAGVDVFCVPINTSEENAARISYVLEALSYYGQESVMPLYYETILTYQYTKDEESIEMLGYIHDSLSFDFAFFYNPGGIATAGSEILNKGGTVSLSGYVDGIVNTIDAALKAWAEMDE